MDSNIYLGNDPIIGTRFYMKDSCALFPSFTRLL
jgi:hypothetical protein